MIYLLQASALAHLGRIQEAKSLIQRAWELEPTLPAGVSLALGIEPELAQRAADVARLAGLPD
jgi:hypothetical protein